MLKVLMVLLSVAMALWAEPQQGMTTVGKDKKVQESFWQMYTNALRGDAVAQFQVGVVYERGLGVEQNQTLAAQWYEKSALQGYVDAQYNIAIMYASGRGIEKNEPLAMMWLAQAAKKGDKEARALLLAIIDEGEKAGKRPLKRDENALAEGETVAITPVTLVAKEGAKVCDQNGECSDYKAKSVFTSKSKRNGFYKISGIVTKNGWEGYEKEGWIAEESVDFRR